MTPLVALHVSIEALLSTLLATQLSATYAWVTTEELRTKEIQKKEVTWETKTR